MGFKMEKQAELKRTGVFENVAKITTPKTDKSKVSTPRNSDPSVHQLSPKIPSKPQGMSTPESSTSRAGVLKDSGILLNSKVVPSTQYQRVTRRDKDQRELTVVEKCISLGEENDSKAQSHSLGYSSTKDRMAKVKNQPLENSKEKHSNNSISDHEQAIEDIQRQPDTNGNHTASDASRFKPNAHSKPADKSVRSTGSSQTEKQDSLVGVGKVMLTTMKPDGTPDKETEPPGLVSPMLIAESQDFTKPPDDSDRAGAVTTNHKSPIADSEPQTGNAYPSQDSNLLLQDGSKSQEDSSYKRRYPRRSARARSNMFFGLTPLYGVRSYGEEDLPFCSSTPGKKRAKRSAEGQVDGADDLSTSDEDELYYYNFTRTVVSNTVDERLGARALFREDDQRNLHKIPQLDGVDDGTENDSSITVNTGKSNQADKRNVKEKSAEKLDVSEEQAEKGQTGKGHKPTDSKMDNCHPVKQDSLELNLDTPRRSHGGTDKNLLDTFNAELLKSDSDNNNSDDCGNILPIDIMDFVLKNTPSMQTLVESPESSSSELLTLGEGLGLETNRGKDMALFEVFSQQLPTSEPGDGPVPSTMSAEEQFELPIELPSDLSVLTTRSPALPNQNHARLGVISESQLPSSGEQTLLSLPSSDTGEKRATEKNVTSNDGKQALLNQTVDRTPEGHITPDRFIPGHIDPEHISSPSCSQVENAGSQELSQNSGTPNMQVPVSPSVPLQNQKYIPNSSESPGSSQITSTSIQGTPPHLKTATEKLVVVNQNMQPLYVLQTLPNGVTQKIQLAPSVPQGTSQMEGDVPVVGPMGGGITLTTALNPALTSPFSPASKGLLPMSHHTHLQPFPTGPQTAFIPSLSNQPSGLLIGVQPSSDPQLIVSDAGQRAELGSTSNSPAPIMSKKRQISRLNSRKNKKLVPSVAPVNRHGPDVVSNMTLINFSPSQLSGLPNHPGLIDLGTLGNTTPHRSIPNIIKRSKSGLMYIDQTPLLPQGISGSVSSGPSVIGLDTSHLTSHVPGLTTGSPVLNVVSMQTAPSAPPVTGHVTLTNQGILSPPELGSISNFLIKTSTQGLGIQDNSDALSTSPSMFPQRSAASMGTTSSICVVPNTQSLAKPINEPDCSYTMPYHTSRVLTSRSGIKRDTSDDPHVRTSTLHSPSSESESKVTKATFTLSPGLQTARSPTTASQKTKSKIKRQAQSADKTSRKKHKASHPSQTTNRTQVAEREEKTPVSILSGHLPVIPESYSPTEEPNPPEAKQEDPKQAGEEEPGFSSPLMRWLQQEQSRQNSPLETKPRTGLLFEISSDDGFQISAHTIEEAWKSLTDKVQEARSNARLKQLSFTGVNGLRMLGIVHDAIVFLIEQLYGANRCRNYKFRFHRPAGEEEPPLNPHGSARAEVNLRKSAFDMFNFLASKHRQPPEYKPNEEEEEEIQLKSARRATSMDLPMPMRFRHLKKTSKEAVGVYRSPIHGRGLFCKRNIDAGEMVIEYSGNVIRSTLTDKREKYYEGKGIGCYMFRIDETEVVDATMHGNAARFINHSCEPNCYSRVIPIDGQKHIVIFAMRKIYRGEELTYDYKFPIEDASNKLACNCGTKKCRKFLN
ncbi:histone-lysine N-methyltransferase 2A isoform X2 [Bombina bombina]|uniref:histone-lysine N-methyltransferase 2A isoform X2 n=1 Tax=Bombina bombina TaxID=8345 RepID=UPI00235B17FD|nr:histone-lysine N-methyltransferase 2A isoform X2 [Bombina bombina]